MALVISLVLLLAISILGVTALNSSRLMSQVSMNAQLSSIAFDVAESAINETLFTMFDPENNDPFIADQVLEVINGNTVVWCLRADGSRLVDTCGNDDFFDSRGFALAEARVASTGFTPVPGGQISQTGGAASMLVDIELTIQGNSTLVGFGMGNRHVQQALRRGMIPMEEF